MFSKSWRIHLLEHYTDIKSDHYRDCIVTWGKVYDKTLSGNTMQILQLLQLQ